MADTEGNIKFQSVVEHHNQSNLLTLTKYQLSWDQSSRTRSFDSQLLEPLVRHDSSIDLREVIGVKPIRIPHKPSTLSLKRAHKVSENVPICIEMQALGPQGFCVYYLTRPGHHKWRYEAIAFQCKDSNTCQQWITAIREAVKNPEFQRPQNIVVFVNPISGKKRALRVYQEKVQPLFELADIKVSLVETQRQNHARDLVYESLNLEAIDGVVVLGGDGMVAEVLNGLLRRSAKTNHIDEVGDFQPVPPKIRIGIIPVGSTNTIVYSTTGGCDHVTSALQIILGSRLGIDVSTVMMNDRLDRYTVTSVSYGYMGDLLKDSDNKRWMGPKRYEWSGTKAFFANKVYYGELKFKLSPNHDSHPTDQVKCYTGCDTCYCAKENQQEAIHHPAGSDTQDEAVDPWRTVTGRFAAINSVSMSCCCDRSLPGMSPCCHLGDGCTDLILVRDCSRTQFLKFLLRTQKGEDVSITHYLIVRDCSRTQLLKFLLRTQKGEDRHTLDFVEMYRVKEFTFRPLSGDADVERVTEGEHLSHSKKVRLKHQMAKTSCWNCDGEVVNTLQLTVSKKVRLKHQMAKTSCWNCDGEVVNTLQLTVRTHCQLIELFASGVMDPSLVVEEQKCHMCCAAHTGSL